MMPTYDPPLDAGIARYVEVLNAAGVETYESCEGGNGHAYPVPTVCFHGDRSEGLRALDVAMKNALPVQSLNRFWTVIEGEPTGPQWQMTFWRKDESLPLLSKVGALGAEGLATSPGAFVFRLDVVPGVAVGVVVVDGLLDRVPR